MMHYLRVATFPGEMRLAVTQDDTLLDYALWRPATPDLVGNIYVARIAAQAAFMGGAFVDLGHGLQGFLSDQKAVSHLTEGQSITVCVSRAAQGGKGVRVRMLEPSAQGKDVGLVTTGPTPLERLAAQWPNAIITVDTPQAAALVPPSLRAKREAGFTPMPPEIMAACHALEDSTVDLPGNMQATITPTPALIAIDMDAPPVAGSRPKQTAQFAANRDALPELLHQIRLRNLSGAIVIDPAGMAMRKRQALQDVVQEALRADPLRPRCLGVSALGLIEIVRPRIHPSLPELLNSPHGHALKALRTILAQAPTATILRGSIPLIRALEQDPQAVADCVQLRGKPLALKADPALPDFFWTVQDA
ncbi:ribonuclease E/G [Acetobacter sp. AAB5]|uniref:ribonuclease E/G n=1 Tax=Acetobacter sp. AAB5 TaxID=3418370 RepID=UPI003CEE96EE